MNMYNKGCKTLAVGSSPGWELGNNNKLECCEMSERAYEWDDNNTKRTCDFESLERQHTSQGIVRFEALTATNITMTVFRDVPLCSLVSTRSQ